MNLIIVNAKFQNVGTDKIGVGVGGGDVGYWHIGGPGASAVGSVIRSWTSNQFGLRTKGVVQGLHDAPFSLVSSVPEPETCAKNHKGPQGPFLCAPSMGALLRVQVPS